MAAEDCRTNPGRSPRDAWNAVAAAHIEKLAAKKKGCPRSAFLGLCEAGLLKGIPAGEYVGSKKNKQYAVDAVWLLREEATFADDIPGLWRCLSLKQHNGQMDVVVALWNEGVIEGAAMAGAASISSWKPL